MISPLRLGALTLDAPLALAPLAGYSSLPMRLLSRSAGAGIVFSEMVSATALHFGNPRTETLLATCPQEKPVGIQIFGAEPDRMAATARRAVEAGADLVDINMGCTVPKVTRTGAGAALLADPDRAVAIAEAVVESVSCLVTAKLRAGGDETDSSWLDLASRLVQAGVAALTLHGRTVQQRFTGQCCRRSIARLVERVPVPVFGNGDVDGPDAAERMLQETGCAGVMIGRAAIGNPWVFTQVAARLHGEPPPPPPQPIERVLVGLAHLRMLVALVGERRGVVEMRSVLPRYASGLPGAREFRRRLMGTAALREVSALLREYAAGLGRQPHKEESGTTCTTS